MRVEATAQAGKRVGLCLLYGRGLCQVSGQEVYLPFVELVLECCQLSQELHQR